MKSTRCAPQISISRALLDAPNASAPRTLSQIGAGMAPTFPFGKEPALRSKVVFRLEVSEVAANQSIHSEAFDIGIKLRKDDQSHDQPDHGKIVTAQPVEVFVSAVFAHEQHDDAAAVEGRSGQQVERAEQQIQREENEKDDGGKIRAAGVGVSAEPLHRR